MYSFTALYRCNIHHYRSTHKTIFFTIITITITTEKEALLASPRTLIRRNLARALHFGMQRQSDHFVICEWGCGMWLPYGR